MNLTHAITWSFLAEIASKAVTPLVFVILARLLTPEDYGVVAAATMVISFCQVFWEAGMSKALIQYQGDRAAAATVAFWINVSLGVGVALLLGASASVVATEIFHDRRVTAVLQVMTIEVLLAALASVHTALLQKDMRFKQLFWVRLLTVTAPGLISIPLAMSGFGYWSLVAGVIAGQAVQVVLLWRLSPWRPALSFDTECARTLSRFGAWVALSGLLTWVYLWLDSLFVSVYFGADTLGLYRAGGSLVVMVYGLVFGPILPVLYSFLSGIQDDRARVQRALQTVIRLITCIAVPAAFLLYALAAPIGGLVFGQKWLGVEQVIAVMALMHGFSWIVGANGEAYRAIGRPQYETNIMAASLGVYLIAYFLSVRQGFEVFLWARLGTALLAMGVHLWVAHIAVGLRIGETVRYVLKLSLVGLPLVFMAHHLEYFGASAFAQLALVAGVGATIVGAYIWIIERNGLIPETLSRVRERLR